jgi:hypothetical protein
MKVGIDRNRFYRQVVYIPKSAASYIGSGTQNYLKLL